MREGDEFEFELPGEYGDLVEVDGYEGRLFRLQNYMLIRNCFPMHEWNEVVCEVADVVTGEWIEADGDDILFVAGWEEADEFLQANLAAYVDFKNEEEGAINMFGQPFKPERPPSARELSAQEAERRKKERKEKAAQIDNLLDIANWNRKMYEKTGDESYNDRVFATEAELMKLMEAD
jgi:hypothetical protein